MSHQSGGRRWTLGVRYARTLVGTCTSCSLALSLPAWAMPPSPAQLEAAKAYHAAAGGQTFIVAYNGVTIAESYDNGGSTTRRQLLASASKGFTGMIGAMAASDGIINLDEPVAVHALTEWQGDPQKSLITYRHLLTMSSGLRELNDLASWTDYLAAPVDHAAGSTFIYSGDPNIFGLALERRLGGESVVSYMNRRLFTPLGMTSIQWSPGSFTDGHPNLSGGAFVTARDWAKFGKFVLEMSTNAWAGPNLVSKPLFDQLFLGNPSHPAYGFYWWLKNPVPPELAAVIDANNSNQFSRQIAPIINDPTVPDDFFMAAGAYEQRLYVIPSLNLFALRNGPTTAAGRFVDTEFLDRLLGSVPGPPCPIDFNANGTRESADIFAFLNTYFAGGTPIQRIDFNCSGTREPADVFNFLTKYFANDCASCP